MKKPRIAIIGSPWLRDSEGNRLLDANAIEHETRALAAGEELGRELARAGCQLLVYSADDHSIERAVVKGFVRLKKDRHEIDFRHPRGVGGRFPEQDLSQEPIKDRTDPAADWVVSFYGSLRDADGVLLLGGRATVLIAGHVAIAFGRPVATVAAFDGSAAEVWRELRQVKDLTQEEYDTMGRPWGLDSAKTIVGSLVRRHAERASAEQDRLAREDARDAELARHRQAEAERRTGRGTLLVTAGAFVTVLAFMVIGQGQSTTGATFLALFIGALTLAGLAGAGLRVLRSGQTEHHAKALLFGAVAGVIFSLLYLAPQLVGDQSLLSTVQLTPLIRWQILIAPILGIAGGLAADSVLTSLQKSADNYGMQLPAFAGSPGEGNHRDAKPKGA